MIHAMSERMARRLAPAVLALFVAIGTLFSSQPTGVVIGSAAVGVVAGLLMRWAGGLPLLGLALIAAAAVAVICSGSSSNVGWFALCFLTGWCVLKGGTTIGVTFAVTAVGLLGIEWAIATDPGWAPWIVGTLGTAAVCVMAHRQQELLWQLRQAQAGLADRARAEERIRISGELHDVIAHSLTVSLLHVTSARLAVEEDPAEAVTALAEAERLGRQSLTEVRQAVGLLRDGDATSVTPMPGVEQVPALIDGFRNAGVWISYHLDGDPSRFSATVALTVYRILQEALTNAARHSFGAETSVRLETASSGTTLTIDSVGTPRFAYVEGIGLRNMRQRAESLGGTLEAGPSATGWRVRATLPGTGTTGSGDSSGSGTGINGTSSDLPGPNSAGLG
jgi:signal transduction histidine kinase